MPSPDSTSRAQSRSRSPHRESHRRHRARSRSPHRDREKHKSHKHERRHRSPPPPLEKQAPLPYKARKLSKHDFEEYKPLFQSYLDIQKQLNLDELDEREARGRWKSFVSRWNRGDLARSWYDPSMLKTAKETVSSYRRSSPAAERQKRASPTYNAPSQRNTEPEQDSQSEDEFGPAAPKQDYAASRRTGPTMPRMDDLALRDQLVEESRSKEGLDYRDDIRFHRKQDRRTQKERLEELVPRADPGSRERQLEKKRETTSTLNEFRNAKESGDVEVPEADLMGADDMDAYKRSKKEMERKKNEREVRKEEIMRARAAEREERLREIRAKEESTMEYLRAIARERFG